MNYNNIGKKLKNLRIKNNMSQEEVAKKCFVTRQAVSRWENNKSIPDYETLKMIIKLYDIDMNSLFFDIKEENNYKNLIILLKNNLKYNKLKYKLLFIFILLIIFFSLFFTLTNYNKTRVYYVNYVDENISCSNGLIALTPYKTFFKGCTPNLINNELNNEIIDSIEFYYKKDKTQKLIYSGGINSTDFIWEDDKITEELFYTKDIRNKIPKIYVKIITNLNTYELELNVLNTYKNSI